MPQNPLELLANQSAESLEYADTSSFGINWLLYGKPAAGKTHAASTGRQPVYIQSFDKQGSELPHIRQLAREGKCIINRDCEHDDPKRPSAVLKLEKNFNTLLAAGSFNHIGTYVIDSLTFLSEAIMNEILRKHGRTDTNPQLQDYNEYKRSILKILDSACGLPCDFVLTAHLDIERDDSDNSIITNVLATGRKIPPMIPRYFGEFFASDVIYKGNEPEYRLITKPYKRYMARTRIGSGIFSTHETPDLMYLREKAGQGVSHLPPIAQPKKETA